MVPIWWGLTRDSPGALCCPHPHGASKMVFVFQKNIVHRDLKLGNMVLNKR